MTTIAEGAKVYEDGKSMLQLAISQYDQAVVDLTASTLVGMLQYAFKTLRDQKCIRINACVKLSVTMKSF
jgi:hypothetical protein